MERLRLESLSWGMDFSKDQLLMFERYAGLLSTYTLANVIGTKERDAIILDHILASLGCLTNKTANWTGSLIDVGTGGGLPGVPLAIARPQMHVTLLEAVGKKIRFLQTLLEEIDLSNADLLQARAEDVGRDDAYRDRFDISVARAVAWLPVVVEYCMPLIREGGVQVAMKGHMQAEEFEAGRAAATSLNARVRELQRVDYRYVPAPKEHTLVVVEKLGTTPRQFPRKVGLAKKRPLGAAGGSGQ